MEYFYQIARAAGVKKVTVGILYYGGCSLQQHITFGLRDEPAYDYRKNTNGTWKVRSSSTLEYGLLDEDWDYISIQESGRIGGITANYAFLAPLLKYVRERSGDAELLWHMIWIDQATSTRDSFIQYYGGDQLNAYNMFVDCYENLAMKEENGFKLCIPNTTAIQNARTSFLGDNLTRDGYHLDKGVGRYIAALTYYIAITGDSVDRLTHNPNPSLITDAMMAVAHESVKNAIANPYEITPSALTTRELAEAAYQK